MFEHPFQLTMPALSLPGILIGRSSNEGFPQYCESVTYSNQAAQRLCNLLAEKDPQKRNLIWNIDVGNLTKMLAKIGYGFAIYYLDRKFEPLVTQLILAQRDDAIFGPYFVGGPFVQPGTLGNIAT